MARFPQKNVTYNTQRSLVLWCYLYSQGPRESLELVLNVQCVSDDGWLEPRAQDSSTSWSPSFCLCVGVLAGDTAPREIRIWAPVRRSARDPRL